MAALGSAVDSLGPFVDGDAILDGISRRSRSAWPAAFVTTREITPQLLGPLGCPIDERRRSSRNSRPADDVRFLPLASRKFAPGSTPPRGGRQRRFVGRDLVRSALHVAAQLIGSGGVKRRVASARQLIAGEFARDRRFRTADRLRDRATRPPQAGYWCSRFARRPNVRLIWCGNDQIMETGSDLGYRNSDRSFTYARLNLND